MEHVSSNFVTQLITVLAQDEYLLYTGVPCSLLRGIFKILEGGATHINPNISYIPAIREDSAIGVAVGAYLAGKKSVVLMQNSGVGYCLNGITSLVLTYSIPLLLIIGWRGADSTDAIEHAINGRLLPELLKSIEVPFFTFNPFDVEGSVTKCINSINNMKITTALLIRDAI